MSASPAAATVGAPNRHSLPGINPWRLLRKRCARCPEYFRMTSTIPSLAGSIGLGDGFRIAVLLPCYNEALTIGHVVRGFVEALPGAEVYVFDNNSTDD